MDEIAGMDAARSVADACRGRWHRLLDDPAHLTGHVPALDGAAGHRLGRRQVMQAVAASLMLDGLAGCGQGESLFPAVRAPAGIVPGRPDHYASAHVLGGDALGIVVRHTTGRPIKIEGNPHHPASLGATDPWAQASLLDFYDPDRAAGLLYRGRPAGAAALRAELAALRDRLRARQGAGLRLVTGRVTSPTLGRLIDRAVARWPGARWHQWEPAWRTNADAGAVRAYGRPVDLLPYPARADVILALDSDLIGSAPGHVRHARDLAGRRNPTRTARMSRLYAIEPTPTLIGAVADHRFPAAPDALRRLLGMIGAAILQGAALPSDAPHWLAPLIRDLQAHRGAALLHAGPSLAPEDHALVLAVNEALGGRGRTFDLIDPTAYRNVDMASDMAALLDDMQAGRVEALLVLDSNPAFTLPGFADAMARVDLSIALARAPDETSALARWSVPLAHDFECWGDARAFDGTATIMQPQALPLFGAVSAPAILDALTGPEGAGSPGSYDACRLTWRDRLDDAAWRDALALGVVGGTAHAPLDTPLRLPLRDLAPPALPPPLPPAAPDGPRLACRPDPHLWDGRFANNPWLQELPRPATRLVWDNPLLIAPATARALGLVNGAEVEIAAGGRTMRLPVWIVPGQAAGVVVAQFGAGRHVVGAVGRHAGYDTYPLRPAEGAAVTLRPTGRQVAIASTDHHDVMDAAPGDIARQGTLAEFLARPDFLKGDAVGPELYRLPPGGQTAWGMSIDLNACIGCNACVAACGAENNVPVVGKDAVLHQREMHWLRIDHYFDGPEDAPDIRRQPVLCMQCEQAPCEIVCPFGATMHDQEGLNVMVYNRCAGTRFCSNNCPYRVRRFNYGAYAAAEPRPAESRNPDVTVRARGVMEKCTFCIQRIAQARIAHDIDGTPEQVTTACQAACPTRAFTFGDLNDPASDVARRKRSPLDYVLLPEHNTRPRVTYEARIRNPNPEIGT
ncbi:4Fe-4S dicluster domain-containing protein [Nguyenibacter sp. L1]|uniref:4Fe-4S dicluster domain-containing protein n=1 Tax=Nguyenibacter sp. L1 TaxID=3049350 RepID=UPI002B481458|nr:4Fe-4S dicluster domain-containing protein [Nguyenibacter sp. L1]WRH88896.1 4Fe-4S dicluster domain-containing protein [Nguyenibacter sp. L1]